MRIDIVTLFPELCDGFLSASILGRARAKNLFEAHCHQIRDYTKNKQKQTDDYPYGVSKSRPAVSLSLQSLVKNPQKISRQFSKNGF